VISVIPWITASEAAMMGRRCGDQAGLFYQFRLDARVPKDHLLRRIDCFVMMALSDMHERLKLGVVGLASSPKKKKPCQSRASFHCVLA